MRPRPRIKAKDLRALAIITVVAVIAVAGMFNSALSGAGNLSSFGYGLISAVCPLGAVEAMIAANTVIPRALLSLGVVLLLAVLFGRAFCAWVCPAPLLQRWFPGRRGTKNGSSGQDGPDGEGGQPGPGAPASDSRAYRLMRSVGFDSRYIVLGGALVSTAAFGFPVFCLVCPVGLVFATIFTVFRLFAFGELTVTLLAFPIILVLELVVFRKWCTRICPLGALVSLMAAANRFFRVSWDESKCLEATQGMRCSLCHKACSREKVDPRGKEPAARGPNSCTKCRECTDACPAKAISFPFLPE
ncbi:MAG: 4Fe-4S binding protein [Coriobacteriaceae bacterium]|jgi:ferredoxin-type protein NapH|nr:4Fe-4S binding protein [Coriobacteriaceae bacterium]